MNLKMPVPKEQNKWLAENMTKHNHTIVFRKEDEKKIEERDTTLTKMQETKDTMIKLILKVNAIEIKYTT